MSWEFKVGQKVVCVDDSQPPKGRANVPTWKRGDIYTISELTPPYLRLVEQVAIWNNRHGQWRAERFRPLVTDTQKWLREILETPPQTAKRREVERFP